MRFLIIALFGWCGSAVAGCSCDRLSVAAAYNSAEIIFEGKILNVTGPISPGSWPAGNVIFAVSRVWKGNVSATFEMPAVVVGSSCLGFYSFLLKPGNLLLVYARRVAWTPKGEKGYFTDACARTQNLKDARVDLEGLKALSRMPQEGIRERK